MNNPGHQPEPWSRDGSEEDPEAGFDLEFEREQEEPSAGERAPRLKKAPSAFRTISEVADELHIPQHVLRFWETRFPQVKPLKRGGGRRYYRPDDIALLRRISDLLYIQGYTIKGVQRLLREGDGTLSGDLPPPDVADRGDEEALPAAAPDAQPVGEEVSAAAEEAAASSLTPDLHAGESALRAAEIVTLQEEVARLRTALRSVLQGLETMRARLPH